MGEINNVLSGTANNVLVSLGGFLPRLVSGLIILLIGIIIATFVKQLLFELFKFLKLEVLLKKYGVPESRENMSWSSIVAEIARWFIVILFLVPTAEVWGLGKFVDTLNNLLLYLPNVFIAVLLLLVGFVVSRLAYNLIHASIHGLSSEAAKTVALVGRWSVLIFTFLVVLNQLGIASDLIRILFTGFVAMLAIAGGLAFGLGGQDAAKQILEKIKGKI